MTSSRPAAPASTDRHGQSAPTGASSRIPRAGESEPAVGVLGRLGVGCARHFRIVLIGWLLLLIGLGAFAPQAETSLAGAGWHASGSESVRARDLVDRQFAGLSSSALQVVIQTDDPRQEGDRVAAVSQKVSELLSSDSRIRDVVPAQAGVSISADGRTAVIRAGAATDSNTMVEAARDLKEPLTRLSGNGIQVSLTGSSAMWSDFNESNMTAMLRSELFSWPVTMIILVLAFGSVVAAGLPLMLTMAGLMASAGILYFTTQVLPVSIWAMNFAMMFSMALGIDYALFLVMRFRAALAERDESPPDSIHAVARVMDTAGKAVLFSGLTVLVSLSAVMLVPSPAFRSMALGIILSVLFVLTATLTLLPAVLAKLGTRIDRWRLPIARPAVSGSRVSRAWAERLWRHPVLIGGTGLVVLLALSAPLLGLRTGMPSIAVVPTDATSRVGFEQVQAAFGPGSAATLQVLTPSGQSAAAISTLQGDPGVETVIPAQSSGQGWSLIEVIPTAAPSTPALSDTIDRLRASLPDTALVGGAPAESHDLEAALSERTPLVIAVVLLLGFLLMLVALQAPLVALLAVAINLLAVAATFGIARLIFQEGHGASLLGFTSQGFLNAWGPVFFFAMIFAISMDYTIFFLATAKEHWDHSHDPRVAVVEGLTHSGRVIFAAGAVMVAVFLTFALSGPLPPKEMGIILGIAVLLDTFVVRLMLLPVLLRLAGSAAWWSPTWLQRLLPPLSLSH